MIVLEGVHWSTDWSIFDKLLDDNVLYQFHKYWNNPDKESIGQYLEFREAHQVPIYMGEGGENNREWYIGAFSMFEDLEISWNFWTYKKMDNDNSICSIKKPKDWDSLVENIHNNKITNYKIAQMILNEFIDNIKFDHCHYYKGVVDALLCRAPITIPAIFYSYLGDGQGHYMNADYNTDIGFRESDKTHISFVDSTKLQINFSNGQGQRWQEDDLSVVRLREDEWLKYEVTIPEDNHYDISVSAKRLTTASYLELMIDDAYREVIGISSDVMGPHGLEERVKLCKGKHSIIMKVISGSTSIQSITIKAQNY